MFQLDEEYLSITASDLHTTMTVSIVPDKADEIGVVAIPAKILLDTLKTLADVPVSFVIDKETLNIEISAGDGNYRLPGHLSDEYPQLPEKEDVTELNVSASIISNAISKTLFAAGNDELRPVMSGVLCEIWEDNLTFVATDAHKLVRYRRNDSGSSNTASFILPKKPLNQLKSVLHYDEEMPVKLEYNQTNAYFAFDNIKLVCRLVEGKYPNYDAVIPQENPNVLTVDRIPFLNALKRVSIFANQSTYQVRLKMSGQELLLSAEDIDFSNEAKERLSCHFDGEDMEIGFNSKFLQEMVNNLDADNIKIEMSAPNRAGIISPILDSDDNAEDILMLVMPVMLNS